jgi:hypothetical protein
VSGAAGSGAAESCELFTEDDLLGAWSGAAGSRELFTEDYRLAAGAVGWELRAAER